MPVAPGTVAPFFYRDTRAGVATLTAEAPGTTRATREVTVVAGAATRISVTPASREVRARGEFDVHGRGGGQLRERDPGEPHVERRTDRARDVRPRPGRRGDVQGGTPARQRNRHGDGGSSDGRRLRDRRRARRDDCESQGRDLPQHVSRSRGHARGGRRTAPTRPGTSLALVVRLDDAGLPARRRRDRRRRQDRDSACRRAGDASRSSSRARPRRDSPGTAARLVTASAVASRRRRAETRATPSASRARSRAAGSRSCPRRSA